MKATLHDVYDSLTWRNSLVFLGIVLLSIFSIDIVGYMIWRRFPAPLLVVGVAVLGWLIGHLIGHRGLAQVLNAASVGLGVFGALILCGAVVDGAIFPEKGYLSNGVQITMWSWIFFHIWRAWMVLQKMPPDRMIHVTEGTAAIYAQMTYREARAKEVLEKYEVARKKVQKMRLIGH